MLEKQPRAMSDDWSARRLHEAMCGMSRYLPLASIRLNKLLAVMDQDSTIVEHQKE